MAELTMKALDAGALDFILKPVGKSAEESTDQLRSDLSRLVSVAKARKYARQIRSFSDKAAKHFPAAKPADSECIPFRKSGRSPRTGGRACTG